MLRALVFFGILVALGCVAVAQTVELRNVEVSIAGAKKLSEKVAYPAPLKLKTEVTSEDNLRVKFNVYNKEKATEISPHQVFVRFFTKNQGEVIYPASASKDGYEVSLTPSEEAEAFNRNTEDYSVEIIVGDLDIVPLRWVLGNFYIEFPEVGKGGAKSQYDPLPNFTHVFSHPERRASVTISLAFSGIIVSLLLVLTIMWTNLGVNVKDFSFSLSALAFHVIMGALFGTLAWYWYSLTVFEFLAYATPLSIAAVFTGRSTLSHIAESRK